MSTIAKVKEAKTKQQQQQMLLELCFQHVTRGLHHLVQQIGGSTTGDQLEMVFNDVAQSKGYPLRMYTNDIKGLDSQVDWLVYRELLGEVVTFAADASSKATVKKFIQAILEQVEEETDSNLHEVKFRLDLIEYAG